MAHEMLNLIQAAEHIHIEVNELKHCAQRGEIAAVKHGDSYLFCHRDLDEWAQRNLLDIGERDLKRRYEKVSCPITKLFNLNAIDLEVGAKAKAGILRDMADLAVKSGLVYDNEGLYQELVQREEAASTAIGNGFALLHPRFHDPYMFEESFIAYGRATHPVFFGATNGEATRHFFLIASTNHETHLNILARLAMMIHASDLAEQLDEAADAEAVLKIIETHETLFL